MFRMPLAARAVQVPQRLYGRPYITIRVADVSFNISPNSFFQGNAAALSTLITAVSHACTYQLPSASTSSVCDGAPRLDFVAPLLPHVAAYGLTKPPCSVH